MLSVSSQGSKKGRGRGMNRAKDLNLGQKIGDGKYRTDCPKKF